MYGSFGRAKFDKRILFDGVLLIFMKTIFMAFVTNRCISLFMTKDSSTQLFKDSADFGWLYGMIPVAPTVYMFAEIYGVHSDFMAVFANLCTFVAGPTLVLAAASLEAAKGLTASQYMSLHDTIAEGMAWVGICLSIPLLLGMFGSRWFLRFPCDFMAVMLLAYVGYSVTTVACIHRDHNGHTNMDLITPPSSSPPSSTPTVTSNKSAFLSFFFETLYQTHMASLTLYLGWKGRRNRTSRNSTRRNSSCGRDCGLRTRLHLGSFIITLGVTLLIYVLYTPSNAQNIIGSKTCAIELFDNGNTRIVTGTYQLLIFCLACCGLYSFHIQRQRRAASRAAKRGARRSDRASDDGVDVNNNDLSTNDNVNNTTALLDLAATRNISHYGLYPPTSPESFKSSAATIPEISLSGEEPVRPLSSANIDNGISPNTGAPKSSPTRVLTIITFALVSILVRGITDTIYNFDSPSTKEISLLAMVATYSQGIVISGLYLLHPYVLASVYRGMDRFIWMCQPTEEMNNLISEVNEIEKNNGVTIENPPSRDSDGGNSKNTREPTGGMGKTLPSGRVASAISPRSTRRLRITTKRQQRTTSASSRSSDLSEPDLLPTTTPTLRLEAFDEEEEFILHQDDGRAFSMPLLAGIRSRSAAMAGSNYGLRFVPTDERSRTNVRSRLLTFRTREASHY
jgi:hypothetical protein